MSRRQREEIPFGSDSFLDVLANDARMPSGNAQQGNCGTLWMPPPLFPISESVDTDTHGLSELSLGEPDKAP